MVRTIVLVFILFISSSILADLKVDMIGASRRVIQDKIEKGKPVTTESRTSDNIILIQGEFSGVKSKFEYNLNFSLNKRFNEKEYKDLLYLGENCYLLLPIKKIEFIFGRKLFSYSPYQKSNWKDGLEGFGIESQLSNQFRLYFYLLDFYRGFPLFEKYFLYKNIEQDIQNGERFRHGVSLVYHRDHIYSKLQFTYLNLGNWGNGTKDDIRSQVVGDSDFIYTGIFTVSTQAKYFIGGIEFQFARGLDKAQSNPNRKEKSIPISGELVRLYFESCWRILQTRFDFFIPDSDKRNKESEVLETGFVGFGSYPSNAFLLNQELNYYPSGWVTPAGFQKEDSIYKGRRNSFWIHSVFSLRLDDFIFILQGDHLTPRRNIGSSNGNISLDRKDYDRSFLFELTSSILYDRRKTDGYFVQINLSKLYTSKDILLDGTSAFLKAGVVF